MVLRYFQSYLHSTLELQSAVPCHFEEDFYVGLENLYKIKWDETENGLPLCREILDNFG